MMKVRVHVKGVTPMLQDRLGPEYADERWVAQGGVLEDGHEAKQRTNKNKTYRQWCEEYCLYKGPNGELGIPLDVLFACVKAAGKRVKLKGMTNISNSQGTLLTEFVEFEETFLPFTVASSTVPFAGNETIPLKTGTQVPWVPDRRPGGGSTGAKVPVVRAKFDKWEFDVTIIIDDTQINVSKIRELFERAGRSPGLGAFRPGRGGQFGRFVVDKWDVLEVVREEEESEATTDGVVGTLVS